MTARQRQLKLGAVSHGVGGPGSPYLWLDEDFPVDASVNIDWYIELARRASVATGHHVPAGPATRDELQRGEAAGDVERVVVGGGHGGDQA